MAVYESVLLPNCMLDDFRWKAVTFVYIHPCIMHWWKLICQDPDDLRSLAILIFNDIILD